MLRSTPRITRRGALALAAGAVGSSTLGLRAFAQTPAELTVFGHKVHQAAATGGPGGDATEPFRKATGATLNWVTLGDNNAIHERLLREASLSSTAIDVGYFLNGRAVPKNLQLFEPLDAFQKDAPIEDIADFAPGLIEPMRLSGALYGVPVRHATNAIVYNAAIFEERGVDPNFKSFEEMIEGAKKLTFKRDDGTQVYGLAFTPVFASNFLALARCTGGEYMTLDRKIVAAEPGMVKALTILADLYKQGVLPRNLATLNNEELVTWIQQGRVAMSVQPYARLVSYNDPQKSRYPGKIKPFLPPMAADLIGKATYAPTVEFWSLVIPKAAQNKKTAWEFIRTLSSKAGTVAMALNGNGPTRLSAYADPKLKELSLFAADEAKGIAAARIHLPAFDEQARAHDVFVEETQAAVLGMKAPQAAMADATKRVQPLVGS